MRESAPQSTFGPNEAERIAMEVLGFTGAMLHRSKTEWRREHPDEVGIYNANIVVATARGEAKKVWWGDFWLSRDQGKLRELADRLGGRVYLLLEFDGRFQNEKQPLVGHAVAWVDPGGEVHLREGLFVWENGAIRWYRTPRERR